MAPMMVRQLRCARWQGALRACRRAWGSTARSDGGGGSGGGSGGGGGGFGGSSAVALEYLRIRGGDLGGWEQAGFSLTAGRAGGRVRIGAVTLDVLDVHDADADGPAGGVDLLGFRNLPDGMHEINGSIPVVRLGDCADHANSDGDSAAGEAHPNGVHRVDHVVVKTSELDRTEEALSRAMGLTLRRRAKFGDSRMLWFREPDRPDAPIIEVVEAAAGDDGQPHTYLWGIALVSDDLEAATAYAPAEAFGPIRAAKQPGRQICTARHDVLGLGLEVALMSPHK